MMRDPDLTLNSLPEMLWTVPITGMIGSLDGELCCPEKWLETGGTAITKIASRTTFNERAITTTFYADVRSRSRQHPRREDRHTVSLSSHRTTRLRLSFTWRNQWPAKCSDGSEMVLRSEEHTSELQSLR